MLCLVFGGGSIEFQLQGFVVGGASIPRPLRITLRSLLPLSSLVDAVDALILVRNSSRSTNRMDRLHIPLCVIALRYCS